MLLDTHVLVWAMLVPDYLSRAAYDALSGSSERVVSAVSLYEIAYKAHLGKWPEVAPLLATDLDAGLRANGFEVAAATGAIMERAGGLDWPHRDPFDRLIVATAQHRGFKLVSKDGTLDNAPGGIERIW
ncbi:MAG: type II toxin-antitoxin system VapC family toxin [Pseudomonadota bacterium]